MRHKHSDNDETQSQEDSFWSQALHRSPQSEFHFVSAIYSQLLVCSDLQGLTITHHVLLVLFSLLKLHSLLLRLCFCDYKQIMYL